MLRLIFSFIFLLSCEFQVSPYTSDVPKLLLNPLNLKMIKDRETINPNNFRVAFISDTHNYYKELMTLINYINSNGPYDFVVVNGDITILGLKDEFLKSKSFFEKLKFPVLVGIGNHDLVANGASIYKKIYGVTDFKFTYKNINFVFYNSNNWETTGLAPNTAWVKSSLNSGSPNILVAHVPPNDSDRFSNKEINNWESLTTQYPIPFIFAGHNHNPVVENFGDSTLITIGSPPKGTFFELINENGVMTYKQINL